MNPNAQGGMMYNQGMAPGMYQNSYQSLTAAGIFPDVIDQFNPMVELAVTYPHGNVMYGNEMKPSMCAKPPQVSWGGEPGALYTLMMVDPDAPSRANPTARCWRHWIVVNIPSGGLVDNGQTISPYMGPAPPKNTGDHRYVFLLFRQNGRIETPALSSHHHDLAGFNPRNWAMQHNLTPIGSMYFMAKHEGMLDTIASKVNAM